MKTFPIRRSDGFLHAFEIGNTFISMGSIKRILRSVQGVSDLKRHFRTDDRLTFVLNGESWVVHEPWGDSSRYWIGPKEAANHAIRVEPVHEAFARYRSPLRRLLANLWRETERL